MIPRTFPSIIEAFQTKMVVYVLPSITGLTAWIDYIPVKGVVTESATLANTYANGGYQVVKSLDSLTGLQAWIGYIPVYEDASYNKPWSTDAGGYVPVGGLFSIPSLFASGAPGVWYDPSDLTTLFQDSAGTTPVTAVEQPVGLMLDKSQGLVLGPELVTNGDFSNGTTGWTGQANVTLSVENGELKGVTSGNSSTYAFQDEVTIAGKWYKATATLRSSTSNLAFEAYNGAFTTKLAGVSLTAPSTNTTVAIYFLATGSSTRIGFGTTTLSSPLTYFADNISVKELPGNHAFQSTSASRPVLKIDGNGKLYIKFDGVDDSLSTNSISFTSTDKMSVFAGVRRMANGGVPVELSSAVGSNAGSFYVFAGDRSLASGAVWTTSSRGSAADNANQAVETAAIYNAPLTNSVTGLYNISGDSTILRINGAQVGAATGDQGTGNYGNYPLYIGRRNNASLPFNGQLYSMVIVGKAVTAGELSSTETYVNQKTGAY